MRLMGLRATALSIWETLLVQRLGVSCGSSDVCIASGFVRAGSKLQSEKKVRKRIGYAGDSSRAK
jgi:hypothetical protein